MIIDIHLDFETYRDLDVRDVGAWAYAMHPSCEVLCASYKIGQGDLQIWDRREPVTRLRQLFYYVGNGALVHAHNATFEYAVWKYATNWPEL